MYSVIKARAVFTPKRHYAEMKFVKGTYVTSSNEAIRLYRDIIRTTRLLKYPNEKGVLWY
jgi:hypothetical protein